MRTNERLFLFPWICKKIGMVFMANGWEVVEVCPIHADESPAIDDSGKPYPNHFEDGHLRRVVAEEMIKEYGRP